ncbi:SET domain containing protein [Rhypophila sp. PSN 637]
MGLKSETLVWIASTGTRTCPLPIDDTTAQEDNPLSYSPWSHIPTCVMADPKLSARKSVPTRKYCVFTNSHHEARGVSIITTPETAASMISLLDEKTNSTAALMSRSKELAFDPPWKIMEMPNKGGLGVIATRKIKRYEEIMIDHATMLLDIKFASVVLAFKGYRLLHLAADQLRDPDSIYSLAKSTEMAADEVENVVRTNSFSTTLGGDEDHMAIYPLVSVCYNFTPFSEVKCLDMRINHACKPNAFTRWIIRSQSTSIAALRDIEPGEEITISYLPLGLTHSERQRRLQKWSFTCSCSLCTAPEEIISASDKQRTEIEDYRDKAIEAFKHGRPYEAISLTKKILNLIPSEELYPWESEQYENLARVYWLIGDKKTGDSYARLSLRKLAEQGFIDAARKEYFDLLVKEFKEDVGMDAGGIIHGKKNK